MKNADMPAMPLFNEHGIPQHVSRLALDNKPNSSGLTKREHFAGLAMQGWLDRCANVPHTVRLKPEDIATFAVQMADALLKELDK